MSSEETQEGQEALPTMPLLEHLAELRRRIIRCLVAFAVSFATCWGFHRQIFAILEAPIVPFLPGDQKLSFFSVSEPFLLYFKTAALAAVFLASPVLLWQLLGFIMPALYKEEKRWAVPLVTVGTLFFIAGGTFAYFVAFPFAVKFLLGMGENFQAVIAASKYLSFLMTVILGMGLMFELPVVIFLLSLAGLVKARFLLRHFRWAVVLIFVAAAIITPTPDIVNLLIFALPTLGLYVLGVLAALWVEKRRARQSAEREAAEAASAGG